MPGGRVQTLKYKKENFAKMKNYIESIFICYYNAFLRW